MIICAALFVLVVRRAILCGGEAPTGPGLEIRDGGGAAVDGGRQSLGEARGWENRFFTGPQLGVYASAAAVAYTIGLAWRALRPEAIGNSKLSPCIDFTWIWLSGKFALFALLSQVYDHSAFSAARVTLVGPPDCILGHFDNPPTILFFTYLLGLMPYSIAFTAWMVATLFVYLASIYLIIPRPVALIASLTPFPVVFNVLCGHNGFLSAGLVGLSLVFAETRPWIAGIFLGLLTYKPQLGLLFPFALLASRNLAGTS